MNSEQQPELTIKELEDHVAQIDVDGDAGALELLEELLEWSYSDHMAIRNN